VKRSLVALLVAGLAPVVAFAAPAHADGPAVPTNSSTNFCPFTFMNGPGPDADYVTYLGPKTIPAGATTTVSVGISEEESAPNGVRVVIVATATDNGMPTLMVPVTANAAGTHHVTVDVPLPAVAGRVWTLNWVATFDSGVHPCASVVPGYHAFVVPAA
jgi:hypothetical protein